MSWTVETLNETVDAEVEALPEDMRARLARIAKLIEEMGLELVGEPHVKHVEGACPFSRQIGSMMEISNGTRIRNAQEVDERPEIPQGL
jgi:hypothetical protein